MSGPEDPSKAIEDAVRQAEIAEDWYDFEPLESDDDDDEA